MKAPTRPAKLAGAAPDPALKNQTGSLASYVASEISQSSATANSATPKNSLTRRDRIDPAFTLTPP